MLPFSASVFQSCQSMKVNGCAHSSTIKTKKRKQQALCTVILYFVFVHRLFSKTKKVGRSHCRSQFCCSTWLGLEPKVNNSAVRSASVDVVISHCLGNLSDILQQLRSLEEIRDIFVYSKCGKSAASETAWSHTLPNVGRCDHTYAHHILSHVCGKRQATSGMVLFMKDTARVHQQAYESGFNNMIATSSGTSGFGCGLIPATISYKAFPYEDLGIWHDRDTLRTFRMAKYDNGVYADHSRVFSSSFKDFGSWLDHVGAELPHGPIPVCYGGSFVVKYTQFTPQKCRVINSSFPFLKRADNIEEGHFMERLWAALLTSEVFVQSNAARVHDASAGFIKTETLGYIGTYYGCS